MNRYRTILWLCLAVIMAFWVSRQGNSLSTPQTPYGIVDLELAGTAEKANAVLDVWATPEAKQTTEDHVLPTSSPEDGRLVARTNIWLDFPFLIAYSGLLYSLLFWSTRRIRNIGPFGKRIGLLLLTTPFIGGICDGVENLFMLDLISDHMNDHSLSDGSAALAAIFAKVKFAAILLGIAGILVHAALNLINKLSAKTA